MIVIVGLVGGVRVGVGVVGKGIGIFMVCYIII